MLGVMHYNKFGSSAVTGRDKSHPSASMQTCPVCLCRFDESGGKLPDGTVVPKEQWTEQVCKSIKDDTVNGGYQAGCCAGMFPPA